MLDALDQVDFDAALVSLFCLAGGYNEESMRLVEERITAISLRCFASRANIARAISQDILCGLYKLDDVLARFEKQYGIAA